jgi:hypothetical protein
MLAVIRPDSWNLPLFLHVLGATVLFGATATVAIAGFASRGRPEHEGLLRSVTSRTFLLGVIPAWILMRVAAQWVLGKEPDPVEDEGWVDVGFIVSEPGALLLIVIGILLLARRRRVLLAIPILAAIYVVALAVAWVAMSGKP